MSTQTIPTTTVAGVDHMVMFPLLSVDANTASTVKLSALSNGMAELPPTRA